MSATTLQKIADRQQALSNEQDRTAAEIERLTAHLGEIRAAKEDLATAHKVILSLNENDPAGQRLDGVPDNPAYQNVLTVLADADRPLRAKDLCHALDIGTEPRHIEAMRAKLKRLVGANLATEPDPGLFMISQSRSGG